MEKRDTRTEQKYQNVDFLDFETLSCSSFLFRIRRLFFSVSQSFECLQANTGNRIVRILSDVSDVSEYELIFGVLILRKTKWKMQSMKMDWKLKIFESQKLHDK